MANTRSGGSPRDGAADSAAISTTSRRQTRSSSVAATTNLRRSTRETKGKKKSDLATTPSPSTTPAERTTRDNPVSSAKKQQRDSTPSSRKSTRVEVTTVPPPASKQDSNARMSIHTEPAKRKGVEQKDNHNDPQSTGRLSKKQKRLNTRSYIALFKATEEQEKSPPVLASPHREDGENASTVQAEDNGADLAHAQSDAHVQVEHEPSNLAANKVLEARSSDLNETSGAILERDELKIGCIQSKLHMPIEICSLNKVVECIPTMETGEQTDGYSNQNSLPELLIGPCSTIHHKEASKTIEIGDSVGTQGACTLRQTKSIQYVETDHNDQICVGCKKKSISDILKRCEGKGCKRHYHLSCIDPPLECVSPGIWLCVACTKKRIQFGVYSVSEGIDSLWDIKDGPQNRKQYFVKYKNLAHVHNRWVSESDLIDSTPQGHDLLSKFSKKIQKEKTISWKQEWAEPHRLLKKRSLMPPKEAEVFFNSLGYKFAFCNTEWLVKWKDLGYEHATWELDTSSFLRTPEAEELKKSYNSRREAARRAPAREKLNKVKEGVFQKLQRLPDGCPPGLDDHLSSINQLREFWYNSRGAIFIDDQERVIKTILFVMSILPDVCRPLLIVSTSAYLSVWEAKFNRLAASINVVVYNGETDVRKSIQDLEFYDNGSMMLQVLLSHPEAILEDIEAMARISWEAILVDDCQSTRVSKCLSQLKALPTKFRMAMLSSPVKENIPEYINLLSFLNPEEHDISSYSNGVSGDRAGTLTALKEKLAYCIAFERKAESSIFSEYWVPARLSQVQLEMYCYSLLSNSSALRSHSKTDNVGALRNILLSLRKCCDHPYLVDQSLQNSLTKGHPLTDILDIGVHSSGKLLLLDRMLQELRTEGLRVLILCQSGGGSVNPMGDILDDFVRQRFGYESYERVERGLQVQKKQIAMSMFNDKKKGRFIFLMDSRACVPSIKLSSVDAVIIYSSDWNPVNDLRALQKISIESKSEHVPIFRLYSSCTVEEKALIFAKHDQMLDSNIRNITPSLSHCLISWGASFHFNRLDKFHNHNYSSKESDGDKLFLDNVVSEFLTITKLSTKVEVGTKRDNAVISRAHLCGLFYSRDTVVIGEREGISSSDGDLPKLWVYWSNLLHGRSPKWQHISEPAQRSRRMIQNMEEPLVNIEERSKMPSEETDEARMKRRKLGEIMDSSQKVPPDENKDTLLSQNNTPSSTHQISVDDTWQELETNNLHGAQRGLHVQLKPELSKLYQLLELPESIKSLCEELLEYILKNHQVSQEPKGILHAFNIALCWRAASLVKHKVNHSESLDLAVKNLNYECSESLVLFVYKKLRILKKKFARRAGKTIKQNQLISASNSSPHEPETSTQLRNDVSILSQAISVDGGFESGSHQEAPSDFWTEEIVSGEKEQLCETEANRGKQLSKDELRSRIMDKGIKFVDKVFSMREKNIQDKHSKEVALLDTHGQREVAKLRGACTLVVKHLRKSHIDQEVITGKINLVIQWFTMLRYAFLEHMKSQRNKLNMQHSAAWTKESQLKERFLQEAKSGQLDNAFDQYIPLPDSDFAVEEFSHFREEIGSCHVHAASVTPLSLDDDSTMEITLVRSVNASEVSSTKVTNGCDEDLIQRLPSEVVSPTVNMSHHNVSDGIDSQRDASLAVQHSAIYNPLLNDSANQESSGGGEKSTGHVGEESTVVSLLQGGPSQRLGDALVEVTTGNSDASVAHSDIPALTAPSSQAMSSVSREVETQRGIITQSLQQNLASLASSEFPQGEPGQEGLPGILSAQPLQSERQPLIPVPNYPSETTQPDQSQSAQMQTDAAPNSAQSSQLFPLASMMVNHPPIDAEPLKNEMHKLRLHMETVNKVHELKKSQLMMECNQEIEKVKWKYDLLIKEHDSTHIQQKKALDDIYDRVVRNQSVAEDFRAKFISQAATQARTHNPQARQTPQASQQAPSRPSLEGSSASPVASSSACRPPVPRPSVQLLQVDRPSSSLSHVSHPSPYSQVSQPPPLVPGNLFRATSAPVGQLPTPHGCYGVQGELAPRAPAPHLHVRPPLMPPGNQQQLSRVEVTSSSSRTQLSQGASLLSSSGPTLLGNPSTSDSHQPPLATSVRQNLHSSLPTTSSASSSHPVLPTSSLAPGSSPSSQHVPPTLNPALLVMAPPACSNMIPCTTAAASNAPLLGRRVGPSVEAGMQATDAGSLSLDAWLTANLGLSSGSPGVAPVNGAVDVVCLSDDDSN